MNEQNFITARRYIYDLVKKIDLAAFIEQEAQVRFSRQGGRMVCRCPMPHHRDRSPSFSVSRMPNEVWVFNCFGCGSGGTIVDFCMAFWSLDTSSEALAKISEKMNLGDTEDIIRHAMQNLRVSVDEERELEVEHVKSSASCQLVLRKYPKNDELWGWVASSYRKMNILLDSGEFKNALQEIRVIHSHARYILEKGQIPYGG
jgi:hypothetical protein